MRARAVFDVQDLLSQDGFPTHHVSVTEKNDFKAALLRQRLVHNYTNTVSIIILTPCD